MYTSIFSHFIKDPRQEGSSELTYEPSDRIITPANIMTASREPLAIECSRRLIKGQRHALEFALASAASDMEGIPARFISKHWPDSGLGISTFGADWDPRADSAAALTIAIGALRGPRVSMLGKASVGIVLGQEGLKTAWALRADHDYRKISQAAEHLWLQPTKGGKEAMAEKFTALCLAVATNETRNPYLRASLGAGAMFMAISGAARGEEARKVYVEELAYMFNELPVGQETTHELAQDILRLESCAATINDESTYTGPRVIN